MTTFPYYQKQVQHVLGDVSSANKAQISLLEGIVGAINNHEKETIEQDNVINKVRYQNLAIESAARAYSQSPNDIEEYKSLYRKQLEGCPIPIARRHEYEAIALNTESKYYSPILLNKETVTKTEANNELLTLADNLCKDGLFVLGGNVPHPDSNYVGDRLTEAFEILSGQDAAGNPVLPVEEISTRIDKYGLDTLTTLAVRELGGLDDPLSAADEYINGKDYVAEINSSRGPMTLSSSSLSEGAQDQFRQNIEAAIIKNLNSKGAREKFANGRYLMEYPATYRGTTAQQNGLDEWARMQLDSQPITAENEHLHIDNMINFSRQFSYIPEPYVEVLSANINGKGNPLVALSSSKLLNLAIEHGGSNICKQFDDVTLLKSQMLVDLIWNGNIEPQKALDTINSIFHDPRSRDYTIQLNEKLRGHLNSQDREKLYGTKVSEKVYGLDGVSMYEDLVRDLYLTNGGDAKSARKVANDRLDSIYSYPTFGYFQKHGLWKLKFGGRKLKYQPEAYYGEGIGKKIDKEMTTSVIPMIQKELGYSDISPKNYFFVANVFTSDAFHAPGKGKVPKWEIWYVNDSGNRIRVTRKNGDVLMYSTAPQAEEGNKVLKKIAEAHSDRVRSIHEEMMLPQEEREEGIRQEILKAYGDGDRIFK